LLLLLISFIYLLFVFRYKHCFCYLFLLKFVIRFLDYQFAANKASYKSTWNKELFSKCGGGSLGD